METNYYVSYQIYKQSTHAIGSQGGKRPVKGSPGGMGYGKKYWMYASPVLVACTNGAELQLEICTTPSISILTISLILCAIYAVCLCLLYL